MAVATTVGDGDGLADGDGFGVTAYVGDGEGVTLGAAGAIARNDV